MSDANAIPQWFSGSKHTHRVAAAIAQYGPIARTTLAQMLGLSQGALSRITSDLIYAGVIEELAGRYIVWIILIPIASAMPFIMDGIMVGATETRVMRDSMFWATAAYFAIYYACYPLIGNNALWLAFTLYMFLRGVIQFFMTRRLKTIYDKIA